MPDLPLLSVIIVAYKSRDEIGPCLASLPRELARDAEAQPGAADRVRHRVILLPEGVEDMLVVFHGDPASGVRHLEVGARIRPHADDPEQEHDVAILRVLRCVGEQVHQDLSQLPRIREQLVALGVPLHSDLQPLFLRERPHEHETLVDDLH